MNSFLVMPSPADGCEHDVVEVSAPTAILSRFIYRRKGKFLLRNPQQGCAVLVATPKRSPTTTVLTQTRSMHRSCRLDPGLRVPNEVFCGPGWFIIVIEDDRVFEIE